MTMTLRDGMNLFIGLVWGFGIGLVAAGYYYRNIIQQMKFSARMLETLRHTDYRDSR